MNNKSTIIIAEAGVNHNGSFKTATDMIDVAKEAGADAVKFQTFKANDDGWGGCVSPATAAAAGKCLPSRPAVAPRQASTSRPGSKISNISIAVHCTYGTVVKLK